jgi:hypothetical protein
MKVKQIQDAIGRHPYLIGFWIFLLDPILGMLVLLKVIKCA